MDGAYDVLIDATDGYGNVVSDTRPVAPRQIVIDATVPTVALVAPAGASLDPAHDPAAADVNPSEPGYQTRITWRVDGESAALGTVICLWVAGEAKPCQAPDEATREATWEVTLGAGSSTLSALARDAAGNVSSTVTATVALLIDAPTVTITAPVAGLVTTASTVDVSVHVADAVSGLPIDGATVGLLVDGAAYEGAPQALGAGDYLFPAVPLPTGASLSLRASATFASDPGVSPERVVVQKDVAPSVAITAPADGALFNLASAACLGTGVPCVTDVTVAFTELEPGAPVSLSVDCGAGVTTLDGTAAADGAPIVFSGVSLAHGPGCALAAEATDAAGQTATAAAIELVDLSAQTVRVEVEDAAGNVASASFDLEVDATPPAAVVLAAIGADAVDAHAPSVALAWTAVGDDGQGGSPAAGYDVRYSKSPITDLSSFEAACAASELAHGAAVPAPAGSGSVEGYLVTGPDPRPDSNPCKFAAATDGSSWYFAVRAVDDAGNQGPIAAAGAASTADLTYRFSHLRFTTGAGFASTAFLGAGGTSIGDFDGDGATDLVAGFFLTNGFCLVQGGALGGDVTIDTKDGVGHHCVAGPASIVADAGAKELGSFIAALGDVNGDGRADFGVSGKTDDASGFIAVYLGRPASADPLGAPDVVIRGADATNSQYGSFCGAGRFGGGAVDALAVGEPGSDRIRAIPGDAAWTAGQATVVIDLDASGVELAHGIHTFEADFGAVAWFGIRCQAAGDVLPTPEGGPAADDLLVLQANNDDARVFVIPGRPLIPGEVGTLTKLDGALTAEDALAVRLRQDPKADGTYATGFGASFLGGRDATGDGVPDVIVAHGGRAASISGADGKALYVFDGAAIAAGQGGDLRVESAGATLVGRAWEGANGSVLRADPSSEFRSVAVIGDYDGWRLDGVATADVAIAGRDFAHVELRMNHEDAGGGAVLGMFPFREATLANPAAPGAGFSAGLWVDGGFDVEGDGRPDVLIGTARGEVLIVH